MSVLFARLPDSPEGWRWYHARSVDDVEAVDDADLADVSASRAVVLVPGSDVHLGRVTAATRSVSDLRTAALFQLEDDLSQPVNELHLAIGPKDDAAPNTRCVAIASRTNMIEWVDACADLPTEISGQIELIPETSLFADGEAFVFDGDGCIVVFDGETAYGCDPHLANDLVPALLQQSEIETCARIRGPGAVLEPVLGTDALSVPGYAEFVAPNLLRRAGIDLRQAEFARRSDRKFSVGGWMGTLGLAAAALLIWVVSLGVSVVGMNRASDDLYQDMITAYARAFPDEGRVVDPSREVALKMRNAPSRSGASFIGLAAALYAGLEEVEGVSLQGMTYDGASGQITASLQFSGYEDRDSLRESFERRGMTLELGGARQEGGVIVGEASLGGRP